ncbi:MAG: outer membrane lipoprotein carrier protein LolA [Desulfuromonadaceae bacterium]|nr:outer membrane lipoprotein carrier protein LolA [Desulfuromonadaceae bacterium]
MLKNLLLKYLLPLLLSALPCYAESAEIAPLLAELKLAAAETETLSSRFVQEKHLAIFAEKLLSQGRFVYRKPDRLRWELLTPVAAGFVLQGEHGERWNSLSREQESFSVDNDPIMGMIAQQLLAWARVDLDWLQSRYRMELQSAEPVTLRLYPLDRGEAEFIDYLEILFAADRRHVAEVLMVEQEGDSTLLRFTDVEINTELPLDAFQVPGF